MDEIQNRKAPERAASGASDDTRRTTAPATATTTPATFLCGFGHASTTAELRRFGVTAARVRAASADGTIERVARGSYVCPHAGRDQRDAAAVHAQVTCLSALESARVWTGLPHDALHLQVPPNGRGKRPSRTSDGRVIVYHWAAPRYPDRARSWLVGSMEAVWQAMRCLDEERAIACLESAVHEGVLTRAEVGVLCRAAPARLQPGIRELEFTADSGLETIVRRRLRHAWYAVVAQVRVHDIGDEDLLVEDCVALEIDGARWHGAERFHPDRIRDLKTEALGRRSIRLTHDQILFEWETTFLAIRRVVDDALSVRALHVGPLLFAKHDPL
ncbi:type IV toxin-antitoxin system AbiEi family antitoxin domain-containing protein [Cryobacterium zhongshanensis]|uniref:Type IV toxin-antitoxin system AbiEi family antitoxin domain-containing protein n=1 Tax=Cryobacterium zhongshanensis TaxID=2928153 RepID=A0AA41QT09_9MICO|nr:type IV toxin-antitoxin system AbiEi family antitoxin domain-containing protein [Cryobacterium zhongshanensis]MCI4656427.1 type IV toxin-antitoxin system AbiEi family antitoxin domain-containing protein [Cryobacterium zhongshanensis]